MTHILVQAFEKSQRRLNLPPIRSGDTIRVSQRIKEGERERTQLFEGVVMAKRGGDGINGSVTVRRIASGIGVERIFNLQAPNIEKVEIVRRAKVRRKKLRYLRKETDIAKALQRERKLPRVTVSTPVAKEDNAQPETKTN